MDTDLKEANSECLPTPAAHLRLAPAAEEPAPKKCLGGLFVRRECWTICRAAKIVLLVSLVLGLFAATWLAYPFLAQTERVQAETLVVEGWIPGYGLEEVVAEFKRGDYARVLTSGGFSKEGWLNSSNRTYADYSAVWLKRLGIPGDKVQSIPCLVQHRDRTYHSAAGVKAWLETNGIPVTAINVVTLGPHARRTRLLHEKAFGNRAKVGVIAIEDRTYDAAHWWRSSEGVREVVGEAIAYIYAKFFFSAPQ